MMLNGKKLVSSFHLGNGQPSGQRQAKTLPGLYGIQTGIATQRTLITPMV